jgi:hypothetical protein
MSAESRSAALYVWLARQRPDLDGKVRQGDTWARHAPDLEYAANRRASYPSFGEQLDAIWHAMKSGQLPKVEPFFSDIETVKAQHPKPSN